MSEGDGPQPPAEQQPEPRQGGVRRFWRARSWKGKTAIIAGLVLLAFIMIGVFAPAEEESATEEVAETQPATVADASAETQPAATSEAPPATTQAQPAGDGDTGRMSESEFEQFQRVHGEVVDEALQFSQEIPACAQIGTAGDLAGFRTCVDDAYSGFEEDATTASVIASDTLDDVANQCKAALNSYVIVLNDFAAAVKEAHDAANLLDFERMITASNQLPPQSRRFARFGNNALVACEPK